MIEGRNGVELNKLDTGGTGHLAETSTLRDFRVLRGRVN
jgi:hypothetical protein